MQELPKQGANITRVQDGWLVRVKLASGVVQEVRCASESQARYFATMLALAPHRPTRLRN